MKDYIIKKGDVLSRIEKKFKVPRSVMLALNPVIKNPDKIQEGWKLKIPERWGEVKASTRMIRQAYIKEWDKKRKDENLKELEKIEKKLPKLKSISSEEFIERPLKKVREIGFSKLRKQEAANLLRMKVKKEKAVIKKEKGILMETIKGLPEASRVVASKIAKVLFAIFPVYPVLKQIWNRTVMPVLKKGTPSREELQKAVDRMEKLQRDFPNNPLRIQLELKNIIEEMKLR